MTPDAPAPDTALLAPVTIDPATVSVAAPAARAAARRFVGRHDIDFAKRVPTDDDESSKD
jgi:hypothetical protein